MNYEEYYEDLNKPCIAYAVETTADGYNKVRIVSGSDDEIWGLIDEEGLPYYEDIPDESEKESTRRWLEGFVRTPNGSVMTPIQVIYQHECVDGDPVEDERDTLFPLLATIGLILEQSAD